MKLLSLAAVAFGVVLSLIPISVSATGGTAQGAASGRTLRFASDLWCPVTCNIRKGSEGFGVDIVRAIYEPLGYKVEYTLMPWTRAVESAITGKVDAVIGASPDDAPSLNFPMEPLSHITDDFYALPNNNIEYKGLDSLKGKRIGTIAGYTYEENVTKMLEEARKKPGMVQDVNGDDAIEQNIRKLISKRIDVILETRMAADYTIRELGMGERVKWIGGDIDAGNAYVAFSPVSEDSRTLVSRFDEGMARMRAEGKINSMRAMYGVGPEKIQPVATAK